MIITKKAVSRRAVLRGLGTTIALPFLDAMLPAFAKASTKPTARFAAIYTPNGISMPYWTPATEGANFELTPTLSPLGPFKDNLLVLSGLCSKQALALTEGGGEHTRAQATFLTGVRPKKTESGDVQLGISVDQIMAREFGHETQLASLELALESVEMSGACDIGYSCAYTGTIAWSGANAPLPMEIDPRAVFERLFGSSSSTDARARLAQVRNDRSILDLVTGDVEQLEGGLGRADRSRLTEYLDSVRDIERRVQLAEAQSNREIPSVEKPAGVPDTLEAHAKLMFDLMVLAYQCDLTRVITLMVGRELSDRSYAMIGVPEAHHALSHHGYDPAKIALQAKVDQFHVQLFAYFLDRLRKTPDGDGSLLDHVNIVYGAGISDSQVHLHYNQPVLHVGGAGSIRGGRHLRFAPDTPLSNLHLTILDKMGLPAEHFGDSTGEIALLSGV